jgi:hypothetical protein
MECAQNQVGAKVCRPRQLLIGNVRIEQNQTEQRKDGDNHDRELCQTAHTLRERFRQDSY